MRRSALAVLATLAAAGTALAAGPTITASVTPDTPGSHSALNVLAKGPFSATGLPTSVQVNVQTGFRSSAKSVPILCNPSKPCPAKSKVGSGEAVATVTPLFGKQTIPFTLYLGTPLQSGDIASIVLRGTVMGQTARVTGRLFKASNGLEILFDHLPNFTPPPGVTVTLDKFTLTAHAVRKAGTKSYSLITNPPACTGHWTGDLTVTFKSGSISKPLSIPCTK